MAFAKAYPSSCGRASRHEGATTPKALGGFAELRIMSGQLSFHAEFTEKEVLAVRDEGDLVCNLASQGYTAPLDFVLACHRAYRCCSTALETCKTSTQFTFGREVNPACTSCLARHAPKRLRDEANTRLQAGEVTVGDLKPEDLVDMDMKAGLGKRWLSACYASSVGFCEKTCAEAEPGAVPEACELCLDHTIADLEESIIAVKRAQEFEPGEYEGGNAY
jgi:hypothetical protein